MPVPENMPCHVVMHPVQAAFAVECRHCGVTEWAYHVRVMQDPGWLARVVERHRLCRGKEG